MGTEDCRWNAIDVLNVVDGAELVIVVRDIYLCVWYGGGTVEIYDVTQAAHDSETQILPPAASSRPTRPSTNTSLNSMAGM